MENLLSSTKFFLASVVLLAACAPNPQTRTETPPNKLPASFTGKYLAVLSDGDWIGQTYADNALPAENPDIVDTLTLVQPDGTLTEVRGETVSNAVTGTPEVMDITKDGTIAFIGELDKQRPAGTMSGDEIPAGDTLRALDLSNLSEPTLLSSVSVPLSPNVVKVNPSGNLVAVSHQRNPDVAVTIVPFQNNVFGTSQSFTPSDLGFSPPDPNRQNFDVQWHPSGRYLSVISATEDKLIFFEVIRESESIRLEPWGAPIQTGQDPNFGGEFTPDGHFFIVVNANNTSQNTQLNYLFARADSLSVVRVGEIGSENPQHEVIQELSGGLDDEAFTISPDGRYIVTVNQYGTYVSRWTPGHNNTPELRLFELNEEGGLSLLETHDFIGYLPQGVTFDTDGDTLAVSVSQRSIDQSQPGGVYFYALGTDDEGKTSLEQLPVRLTVMRGVHELEVR
jgi:hypothetical protein